MRRSHSRRDEKALTRHRPPEHFTLFSKDVRLDLLVSTPRIFEEERPIWQHGRNVASQRIVIHYFPVKARFSWASEPTAILRTTTRDMLVEMGREISHAPRGHVFDLANALFDDFVHFHPAKHERLVDFDRSSGAVHVVWDEPPTRHGLSARSVRATGQAAPAAVRLRIRLLLERAEHGRGFEAQSAYDKAQELIRHYGLSPHDVAGMTCSGSTSSSEERRLPSAASKALPSKRDRSRHRVG